MQDNYNNMQFELRGNIGIIILNRPEALNALNDDLREELLSLLHDIEVNPKVRGLIITGGKEVFAAGGDIKSMMNSTSKEMFFRLGTRDLVSYIEDMSKPVIAAISGYALGSGFELALGCDTRISSTTAVYGFPEIRLGIIPGGSGTQRLSRLVGSATAKDLIFSGKLIDAENAYRLNLVQEIVSPEDLMDKAVEKIQSFIKHSSIALAMAKKSINKGLYVDLNTGDFIEQTCFSLLFSTQDQKEGMKAFIEKRKPHFIND